MAKDSQNKLVQHGSGNQKNKSSKSISANGNGKEKKEKVVSYPELEINDAEQFKEILRAAKESKDFDRYG